MHLNSCYYPGEPTAFSCKMYNFTPATWSQIEGDTGKASFLSSLSSSHREGGDRGLPVGQHQEGSLPPHFFLTSYLICVQDGRFFLGFPIWKCWTCPKYHSCAIYMASLHFFKIMKTIVYDPSIKRPPNVIRATPLPLIQTKVLRLWSEA